MKKYRLMYRNKEYILETKRGQVLTKLRFVLGLLFDEYEILDWEEELIWRHGVDPKWIRERSKR